MSSLARSLLLNVDQKASRPRNVCPSTELSLTISSTGFLKEGGGAGLPPRWADNRRLHLPSSRQPHPIEDEALLFVYRMEIIVVNVTGLERGRRRGRWSDGGSGGV